MSLKIAAFLALVGTLLLTILLGAEFIQSTLNVARGLVAASNTLGSFIHAFASLTLTVFFYAFYKAQR